MTLGDMIAEWQDEATLINALIDFDDLPLLARLQRAADQDGCELADFVRHGVGRPGHPGAGQDQNGRGRPHEHAGLHLFAPPAKGSLVCAPGCRLG